MTRSIAQLVSQTAMMVCCGPGGVGKTTVAAALALEGARQGRRTVVVTIDPARRLADALGAGSLGDAPTLIAGDWPGELWALMLDTRSTFDGLVNRYAPSAAQAEAILANRFYRNIAGALSGTQEYMAAEKLYELHAENRFDLVVVDTPPTRNALDFVDAPRRLTGFLENRIFRLVMLPARTSIWAFNVASQSILRVISRVVGSDLVADAIAFFQAFEGMEDGFRQRAQRVRDLLVDPATAFVVVSAPRHDALRETDFLIGRLRDSGVAIEGLVANRVHPRFGSVPTATIEERARTLEGTPLGALFANLADLQGLADAEEACLLGLADHLSAQPLARVPMLDADVHDLAGLARVADYLVADWS